MSLLTDYEPTTNYRPTQISWDKYNGKIKLESFEKCRDSHQCPMWEAETKQNTGKKCSVYFYTGAET